MNTNIYSLYIYITQYYRPFSLMYFTFKVVFNSFAVHNTINLLYKDRF